MRQRKDKQTWTRGIPTKDGIYWFDEEIIPKFNPEPLLLQIDRGTATVHGRGSSMPLSMIYDPKFDKIFRPRYADIPEPKDWKKLSRPSDIKDNKQGWVESPEGYVGFAILEENTHSVVADILWFNDPNCLSYSGKRIRPGDNYRFGFVKVASRHD